MRVDGDGDVNLAVGADEPGQAHHAVHGHVAVAVAVAVDLNDNDHAHVNARVERL